MSDLSVTAANVGIKGPCVLKSVQVGESVTQGQPGYYNVSDSLYYQADANASAAAANAVGIFLSAASTNGWAIFAQSGSINPGATLTVGETYYVSATKGGIAPAGDVTTGWYPRILGQASSTSQLELAPAGGSTARA